MDLAALVSERPTLSASLTDHLTDKDQRNASQASKSLKGSWGWLDEPTKLYELPLALLDFFGRNEACALSVACSSTQAQCSELVGYFREVWVDSVPHVSQHGGGH